LGGGGLIFSLFCISCSTESNKDQSYVVSSFENDYTIKLVDSIYSRMTLEERIAQLHGIRSNKLIGNNGKLSIDSCKKYIPNGVGHISQFACALNLGNEELRDFVKELQAYLINQTPTGIPAIFHEEAISGFAAKGATVYPQQIGVSCTWNPELASVKTKQTAVAMRDVGATLALSPMADVVRTPHFNRIEESYGEDAYLSSVMTSAFVEGLQGNNLNESVAACTKHFLGYGGGLNNTDKEIIEEILMPHEVAIRKSGSKVVMTGYHSFNGIRTVANDSLLNGILRNYLDFDGVVVSDYSAVSYQWLNGSSENLKKRAMEAINAGNDIELSDGISYPYLGELLEEGCVSEERFEQAVKRALTLKARLGLLDVNPKLYNESNINLDKDEYRKTAYELACQSIVLLKNDGILPIDSDLRKIALVGPNANTFWCMLGDYSYQSMYAFWWGGKINGKEPYINTLFGALKNKLSDNILLNYERGCDWSHQNEATIEKGGNGDPRTLRLKMMLMDGINPTDWDKAIDVAENSDVIIAAMGENPTLCGEGRERKGIRLPGEQEKFVKELISTGKPVVLIMFGGRPQVISNISDGCSAILQAWYPGEEGSNAVADILLGRVNPSGKLSVSYPATEEKGNYCYNNGLYNKERIEYPFGYGLSYTSFSYENLNINDHY
jgi:beta-glucosidase